MTNPLKNLLLCTSLCFAAASCASTGPQTQQPPICEGSEYFCAASKNALVMGTSDPLPNYLPVIEDAYARYSQFFKSEFLKTVIFTHDRMSKDLTSALKKSGYDILFPWTPAGTQTGLSEEAIRKQITAQVPGASQDMIDDLVSKAQAQQSQSTENSIQDPEIETGIIAHELAHMWFIHGRWNKDNNNSETSSRQYGSNAPDWLDEIVAVLTETNGMTQGRQTRLDTIITSDGLAALWPLKTYFTMEHPVHKKTQDLLKMRETLGESRIEGGTTTFRLTGEEARKFLATDSTQKPGNFYTQSRAFADFMIETSGRPYIFDDITSTIKSGGSVQIWLSKTGAQYGLPNNIDALQKQWQAWVLARTANKPTP